MDLQDKIAVGWLCIFGVCVVMIAVAMFYGVVVCGC